MSNTKLLLGLIISLLLTACTTVNQSISYLIPSTKEVKTTPINNSLATYSDGLLSIYFKEYNADLPPDLSITSEPIINAGKQGKVLGISGYSDSTHNAVKNSQIAKKRANAIHQFLEDNGVPLAKMKLIKPADTYHGKAITLDNNRFDIFIMDEE